MSKRLLLPEGYTDRRVIPVPASIPGLGTPIQQVRVDVAIGHDDERVILMLRVGDNQIPVPMEPEQARQFAMAMIVTASDVERHRSPRENAPADGREGMTERSL